ncbi:cytochrome P450 [Halocatena halophila]|uniref:cytochrome P450 n=1 Tax=Halocatena halophila TaxID=2814576 RepID=UPI002ED5A35C
MPSTHTANRPPGPRRLSWLSVARQFIAADTTTTLASLQQEYGDIVRVYFRGESYLISDPGAIQQVLETNQGNYRKSDVYDDQLAELFGDGLLTASEDHWRRQQRVIRPLFRPAAIQTFTELIREETHAMVERWHQHDGPIDLLAETERVTLSIIGKAMFSTDMTPHAERLRDALATVRREFRRQVGGVSLSVPRWVPTQHNRELAEATEFLDSLVYELIERRKQSPNGEDDMLARLLAARTDAGESLSDEQIRDELITFLLAGHETTATALAWCWYLLCHHPSIHRELYEWTQSTDWLTADTPSVDESTLAKHCVQEAMRIYPPVPVISRELRSPDRLCGYTLPAGSDVLLSQFLMHRHEDLWDDPLVYRPARFAGPSDRPTYSYFPFGGGARMCIGRQFALYEAQLILGLAVSACRLTLESPMYDSFDAIERESAVTMQPRPTILTSVDSWE